MDDTQRILTARYQCFFNAFVTHSVGTFGHVGPRSLHGALEHASRSSCQQGTMLGSVPSSALLNPVQAQQGFRAQQIRLELRLPET